MHKLNWPEKNVRFLGAGIIHLMESPCGSLNVIGPHKLIGSGTIRKCGFSRVGVALFEKLLR